MAVTVAVAAPPLTVLAAALLLAKAFRRRDR
jgi:hypothetical protein